MSSVADRLSLSTCWCSGRHTDGYAMIDEMVGLGFKRIELSHGIRVSLVPGILKAIDEKLVEVSSVHNFCPLPGGVNHAAPNLYQPSASDQRERSSWNRYTLQTLDFAEKIGAAKVVMHSGSVRFFFQSPEKKLKNWMGSEELEVIHLSENEAFTHKRDHVMRRIRKASKKPVQRVQASYLQAIEWAKERKLKLCIENREGLAEIPVDSEFAELIDALSAPEQVGYWHDTGHAQIKHQFGLLDHREHLASLKDHLAGFHLHDVTEEGLDHQPIGVGTVDFKMIAEFVRPQHELVIELSPKVSPEGVLASRDYICNLLN
jgi:sugar phosphate isomerase/epimerase